MLHFHRVSDLSPTLSITDLERLLDEVRRHPLPPKEDTIFSIGGRGHYENPISDILAYFMRPDGQHRFGPLFLRAFFACLGAACGEIDLVGGVRVQTRVKFETRERHEIDLLVIGGNWSLVIENKIRHHLGGNDLGEYARHAVRLAGAKQHRFLAVLSPHGTAAEEWPEWKPVSYRQLCSELKERLGSTFFDRPTSKWQVFAREFIVHLENETFQSGTAMTESQIELVEGRMTDLIEAKKLLEIYHSEHLVRKLDDCMKNAVPTPPFRGFKNEDWAYTCDDVPPGEKWRFVFKTPAQEPEVPNKFIVSVWFRDPLTESQRKEALADMARQPDEAGGQWWMIPFERCHHAILFLGSLATKLFAVWAPSPTKMPDSMKQPAD